jgi:hypothetical protein
MKEPDVIDLQPHKWDSDRPKPREPIFGPGLPGVLAWAFGFFVMFAATYWLRH